MLLPKTGANYIQYPFGMAPSYSQCIGENLVVSGTEKLLNDRPVPSDFSDDQMTDLRNSSSLNTRLFCGNLGNLPNPPRQQNRDRWTRFEAELDLPESQLNSVAEPVQSVELNDSQTLHGIPLEECPNNRLVGCNMDNLPLVLCNYRLHQTNLFLPRSRGHHIKQLGIVHLIFERRDTCTGLMDILIRSHKLHRTAFQP